MAMMQALIGSYSSAASVPLDLEFLGSFDEGVNLSGSHTVDISSLPTPSASSFALIIAAGAENDAYNNLADGDSNSYTRHASIENDNYATVFGMAAEVTSMPSSLTFSSGGDRLAFGVYALSGASSLTPYATDTIGPNAPEPYNLSLTTQVGDVCVAVLGHQDDAGGNVTHNSTSIEDWDHAPGNACQARGGSIVATGTTTNITISHGSGNNRGSAIMAAWR